MTTKISENLLFIFESYFKDKLENFSISKEIREIENIHFENTKN